MWLMKENFVEKLIFIVSNWSIQTHTYPHTLNNYFLVRFNKAERIIRSCGYLPSAHKSNDDQFETIDIYECFFDGCNSGNTLKLAKLMWIFGFGLVCFVHGQFF